MSTFSVAVLFLVIGIAIGYGLSLVSRWAQAIAHLREHPEHPDETFSDPGVSVEVDCRGCGQFNRVVSHRLRDRPKCGRCKARLMPGKRIVICRVSPMQGALRTELDTVWADEDRLWQSLANHVAIEAKARAEAQGDQPRVVN